VSDDRRAAVELRHRSQIDGERQHDLLSFAQAQIRRLDEHARGTEIDGFAQLSAAAGNCDVDDCSSTVPRMKAAFHFE
jgi:hypothetical protein